MLGSIFKKTIYEVPVFRDCFVIPYVLCVFLDVICLHVYFKLLRNVANKCLVQCSNSFFFFIYTFINLRCIVRRYTKMVKSFSLWRTRNLRLVNRDLKMKIDFIKTYLNKIKISILKTKRKRMKILNRKSNS